MESRIPIEIHWPASIDASKYFFSPLMRFISQQKLLARPDVWKCFNGRVRTKQIVYFSGVFAADGIIVAGRENVFSVIFICRLTCHAKTQEEKLFPSRFQLDESQNLWLCSSSRLMTLKNPSNDDLRLRNLCPCLITRLTALFLSENKFLPRSISESKRQTRREKRRKKKEIAYPAHSPAKFTLACDAEGFKTFRV